MRTVQTSVALPDIHRVEHHFDLATWHFAHLLHDFGWLPRQQGPVKRQTSDGDHLKERGLAPGTLVDIAVTFPLLPFDWQLKNLIQAVEIFVYREYWYLKHPGGTEDEFVEANARRQHVMWLSEGNRQGEYAKPYDQLSERGKNINRISGQLVAKLNDPTIFIGGTVGGNKSGYQVVERLNRIFQPHQLIHANLPQGASWHAVPRLYEEAAKRESEILIYVFGTPAPESGNGQLSTYTPIEIQSLMDKYADRLIVYFDYNGVDKRPREVMDKLRQDDWYQSRAFACFSSDEVAQATQTLMAERLALAS